MQRLSSVLAGVLVAALFAGPSARPAQASDLDNLMYVTFSGPVEIPGVALPPGTYIFKVADPDMGKRVVQVLSKDGKTVYATFFSLPGTRPAQAGETIVTLYEGGVATGSPEAIKAWFYPGETTGFEFVYPRERAKKTATVNRPFLAGHQTIVRRAFPRPIELKTPAGIQRPGVRSYSSRGDEPLAICLELSLADPFSRKVT